MIPLYHGGKYPY
ncbi:hypothetical protein E2C01_078077 [Portunus trituberculatus]|uniref:Uncharacterized protein n=1 Tax=Portunus trituberculatus TaxID=210409 RepID=A0A5B7IRS4_PORTR|nr:hypothetical protein [Portunus trituberculatus]